MGPKGDISASIQEQEALVTVFKPSVKQSEAEPFSYVI